MKKIFTIIFLLAVTMLTAQVLPVEIKNFTATRFDVSVSIEWQSEVETNNAFYTVERSNDAQKWVKIADVKPSELKIYTLHDTHTEGAYYRLKNTDKDGKVQVFRNVYVEKYRKTFTVFPNPTTNILNVSANEIKIINHLGQTVYNGLGGVVNVSNLAKGFYTVTNGKDFFKFIKQ